MRATLWLVGLFATAVALALFAGDNRGSVTIYWPPHRVDLSVNLAVLSLLGLFVLIYGALRGLAAVAQLPRQARRWRALQRERAAHAMLLDGMVQVMAGRTLRGRRAAEGALAREAALADSEDPVPHAATLRALAHVLAAESGHLLQDRALRTEHLERALALADAGKTQPSGELGEGLRLRAARWALDERDPAAALGWLEALPQGASRRTAALRLKLKAARQAGRTREALDTARLLAKHGAFSTDAARTLVRGLALDLVGEAHDVDQLRSVWAALDAAERAQPEVAARAARRLVALEGDPALAGDWLRPAWQAWVDTPASINDAQRRQLVRAIEGVMTADAERAEGSAGAERGWLARIESAQHASPRDPVLQYVAGMACMNQQLWGKAQTLITQAARSLQDADLRRDAWRALAQLAEQRGDAAAAADAWKQAALR